MTKGASIKFTSYAESIPKLLDLLKVPNELRKYEKIILKPQISDQQSYTSPNFVEAVLKFCLEHKNPETEIFIAEGSDGHDTTELYESTGYQNLSERYSVGLIDLNDTEILELESPDFLRFSTISYPKILSNACIISLPVLKEDEETEISTSLSNMLGAFPAQNYAGFFSLKKNKIRKWPIKYSIHDILRCKMPNFAIIDASKHGYVLAGIPLDIDKQAVKLLGHDWNSVAHLKLIDESFAPKIKKKSQE